MSAIKQSTYAVTAPALLLPYLLSLFPGKGRNKVKALLVHRQVMVNGEVVTRHDYALEPGQEVVIQSIGVKVDSTPLYGIRILFEDEHLLVIDKPSGLLSIASDKERDKTAYHILTDYVRRNDASSQGSRIFIVHRLDRDTSGVMMFAKSAAVKDALQQNWKSAVVERQYAALVEGKVEPETGTLVAWLKESSTRTMYVSHRPNDGQEAITNYRVLQAAPLYSLLQVWLDTGRKNQIRVQMQSIGHSVVGDRRYGASQNPLGRLGLHAESLSFVHPVTNALLRFESPIPKAFWKLVTPLQE